MGCFALGLEVPNPITDEDRVDAGLDRRKLTLDLAVDLAEMVGDALPFVALAALQLVRQRRALRVEVGETFR